MSISSLPFLSFFLSGAVALDQTPAFWDDASEKATTYGSLRQQLKTLAASWRNPGEGEARRGLVLAVLPRTVAGVMALLSATVAGHALFLTDREPLRLGPLLKAYEPEWVVCPTNARPSDLYIHVSWPLAPELTLWRRSTTASLPLHQDLYLLFQPPEPEGSLKTVRLSYKNIASNLEASAEALHVTSEDRALAHLPLSYSFGFSTLALMLGAGASALLTEQNVKSRTFWEQAFAREATLFPGTPFHYDYIAHATLEKLHVPRLQTFWQAGGRLQPERIHELLRQITERKGRFFILLGQTETAPRMAVLPLHACPEKSGTVGHAIRGGHFEIGADSQILYKGPNVMMGYALTRADLTRGDEMNGLWHTGERGTLDPDGFLSLLSK